MSIDFMGVPYYNPPLESIGVIIMEARVLMDQPNSPATNFAEELVSMLRTHVSYQETSMLPP